MKASIKNTNLPYRGEPTKAVYKKPVVRDVSKYLRVELPCQYNPRPAPIPKPRKPVKKAVPPKPRKKRPSAWDDERNVKALIDAYNAGKKYDEISDLLGLSRSAVTKKAIELIADGKIIPRQREWSAREKKRLAEMYMAGATGKEMQEELGRARTSVDQMLNKLRREGRICKRQ